MKRRLVSCTALMAVLVLICATVACDEPTKKAADGVNRYYESLDHVQQAEIKVHQAGKIDEAAHIQVQKSLKLASKAGRELDAAIGIAVQGGDFSAYLDLANKTFDDVLAELKPLNQEELVALANVSKTLLDNAVSFIKQIKALTPSAYQLQEPEPPVRNTLLSFWLALPLLGFAAGAMGVGGSNLLAWVTLFLQLEPVAFDLALRFAMSLKGKSIAEVRAMSMALADKIEATADAEIAASEAKLKG